MVKYVLYIDDVKLYNSSKMLSPFRFYVFNFITNMLMTVLYTLF
jgi:hypothetical protein